MGKKQDFTNDQDIKIFNLVNLYGHKWRKIAIFFHKISK
jgi:hypothetical protein